MVLDSLALPIVQAPMAGAPSTPALAAAVAGAGGLGFVAAGYRSVEQLAEDIAATREAMRLDAPSQGQGAPAFGVNLFAPPGAPVDLADLAPYLARLEAEAQALGVPLGDPRHDDDAYEAKLGLLVEDPVAVVSFTFGCPAPDVITALHAAGSEVWVTVTEPVEAVDAAEAGVDALVVQGVEAGGHRGTWRDGAGGDVGLLALLQLVRGETHLPLVATGGIATGRALAAVLVAGAAAGQLGSAFLRCPEAGTSDAQRRALASGGPTGLTRAFTGRLARGIVNRFQSEHSAAAPSAYPEIHHVTAPLRAKSRAAGDPDGINLWAGQAYPLTPEAPAAEIVRTLAEEARTALAATRIG